MKTRVSAVLALVLTLAVASPVLADCCDSVLSCAASVVTEGLSCVVQEIIATVKSLVNLVSNVLERTSGATQNASNSAQAYVNQTISDMTTQSQQSGADLAAALQQANTLLKQESSLIVAANARAQRVGGGTSSDSPPPTPAPPAAAHPASARPAKPVAQTVAVHPIVTASAAATQPTSGGASNTVQKINASAPQAAASAVQGPAPHGGLTGLFEKSVKEIESLKAAGDPDVAKVAQAMTQARQSEGPGLQSALAVADKAINAPLRDMLSNLNNLLADPTHIWDPSDIVNSLANSVLNNLDTNIGQMVDGITSGPQKAFDAAQPAYDELLTNGDHAKQIAAAMQTAYTQRTEATQVALSNLLPFPTVATGSNTRERMVGAGGRPLYAQLMVTGKAKKQQIAVAPKQQIQAISPLVSQLKALRTKAASARVAKSTYQANFTRQLNTAMAGKTQAQMDAQRDQLIAQARSQFASDPKTRDAVIGLLTSEASKIKATPKH